MRRREKKQSDMIQERDLENSRSRRITSHWPNFHICPKVGLKILPQGTGNNFPESKKWLV